jgi:branched-chain amino acid aminotransferase
MGQEAEDRLVWLDGDILPQSEANVPATTIGVSASTAVFEGIRGYWNKREERLFIFRLGAHFRRFEDSMNLVWMKPAYDPSELARAALELMRANDLREDAYLRVVAFQSGSAFFSKGYELETRILIEPLPLRSYLSEEKNIDVCVSSWTRIADNMMPPRVKAGGNYQNNRRAMMEAKSNGYDNAVLLDARGKVTEASNACLFMIRGGVVTTSPVTSGILESITRATLLQLVSEQMGLLVAEREIDRTELYLAEEAFLCGTGEEIVAINSVDRFALGEDAPGPITRDLKSLYERVVRGEMEEYLYWCSPVL